MAMMGMASLRSSRVQMGLAIVGAVGVFAGARLSQAPATASASALTAETVDGTWELQSVGGDPIGPNVESGVLSQKVVFGHGAVQGETRLLAASAAGTTTMPFPDLSVASVQDSADSHTVTVTWSGTYAVLPNNRLDLHIGKAQYKLAGKINPQTHLLELEQDAILTYKGMALYRSAQSIARK